MPSGIKMTVGLSRQRTGAARLRPKVGDGPRAQRWVAELDPRRKYQSTAAGPMTIIEYAANTARALMAAEIAMAAVNCGAANVTRAQAEKLLADYFARVEQAIPWTENNPLDGRP
jgi:hypothetical protein